MSRKSRPIVAALAITLLGFAAGPPPAAAENAARDHSGGFFLRLSAGGGGASSEIETGVDDFKFSGAAGDFNFAIGGIVANNLALHGTIFGWGVSNPDVEFNGRHFDTDNTDLSMGAVGGGVTYYLMPLNLYFTGSLGVASLTAEGDDIEGESDPGIAVDLAVGKEWFVSNRWGLGAALAFDGHSVKDDRLNEDWSGPAVTVRFSATFN